MYLIPGIIAGIVVFFALLGVLIMFIEEVDIRISIGIIFLLIAVTVALLYFGDVFFIGACIAIGVMAALIGNHVVENLSVV